MKSSMLRRVVSWVFVAVFCAGAVEFSAAATEASAADPTNAAGNRARTFYLLTGKNSEEIRFRLPILERELYRQALLIAARDGLGMQTRDQSLREWRGAAPVDVAWNLRCLPVEVEVEVEVTIGQREKAIWSANRPNGATDPAKISARTALIEALSRADLVKLLKANGFSGTGNTMKPGAAAPDDAEALLNTLEEISQFRILRETHDAIRKDGESEARLGVLVRGYANLAQLTRFHWSIDAQVFEARSLLYAARMVANNPKSPMPLWHHAYAMALAGFQGQALKDLDAVDKLADKTPPPGWVALLPPFCHYNLAKLTDLAATNASQAPLAMYLAFLTIETSQCNVAMLSTSKLALDRNPRCLRIIEAMCANTGPGLLNELAEVGPQVYSTTLSEELEKLPGMPETVSRQIKSVRAGGGPAMRDTICQAMLDEGTPEKDSVELSWAALARDIQETTFAHIRRKADLIALKWGVDASDYVAGVQPLIAEHRFKGIVDALGAWHDLSNKKKVDAMKSVSWEDLTLTELPAYEAELATQSHGPGAANKMLNLFYLNMDTSSLDAEAWLALYRGKLNGPVLDLLLTDLRAASPESPWITCSDIVNHWDAAKADEWEHSHGGYPSIQLALGTKYAELQQWNDAVRCLEHYLRASPDLAGYRSLANVYKAQGREDRWLSTLKDYLEKTDNIALEHAQVQVEIANYYISHRKYKESLPYADAAAGTGAAWGLECAAQAHTRAGQFAEAEQLLIEDCLHYSYSPFFVVEWCTQTLHGDRRAAIREFHAYINSKAGNLSTEDTMQLALVDELEGKTAGAIAELNKRFTKTPGPLSLLHVILFADESGDAAALNTALKQAADLQQGDAVMLTYLKELTKACHAPASTLDLKAVDEIIENAPRPDNRLNCRILTARYLIKHGQKEDAIRYVKASLSESTVNYSDYLLVFETAANLGLDAMALTEPPAK